MLIITAGQKANAYLEICPDSRVRRRERVNSAVDKALRLGLLEDAPEVKHRYARRCDAQWKLRRLGMLDTLRRRTTGGRVNETERAEALEAFWNEVDNEIARGDMPQP